MALPGSNATPFRLKFSCNSLPSMDLLSKSDPMVVLFEMIEGRWNELGRTEKIQDNENPKFTRNIIARFNFEKTISLRAAVFDIDTESSNLAEQDYIGELFFTLGELVGARGQTLTRPLKKKTKGNSPQGTITIYGEEVSESKLSLKLSFQAKNLERKDFLGKSDPFLVIERKVSDGNYQRVHKTEYIKQNLNPTWKPFTLTLSELCNGQMDRFIKIDCYDWDSDTSQDYIGSCEIRVSQLVTGATFPLVNPKKISKSSYTNSGVLILSNVEQIATYSFLDYVAGGFNISLMFAIDFTGSNGNPTYPSSLHYLHPSGAMNGYQIAISSVGNIVAYYDYDKMFPVFGFGGCFPPSAPVSHNFALNGNVSMPEVVGIDGVLSAYNYCVSNCALSGPTNFAPIIKYAIQLAEDSVTREELKYFILLILTDGEICDMSDTVNAIVKASTLPISIIITGIGSANFGNMRILDGDEQRLRNTDGIEAQRDIVQFVPLRDMPQNDIGALAAHTLAEVPEQFMSYVQMKRIPPPPRIVV